MQKTMKFTLVVEYNMPSGELDVDEVEKAHMEVFEGNPGDFINYLLGREDTCAEYGFEGSNGELANKLKEEDNEFECEMYFYHKESKDNNICRKYGALCGNVLCTHLK